MNGKRFKLIQGDCLEVMQSLIDDGVKADMILTDPPYGTIKGLGIEGYKNRDISWDNALPTEPMLNYCEKLLRLKGTLILFSQEPYTSQLRTFNYPNLVFTYPLYWFKDHFANGLTSKKAPVSYVEDLSVFRKEWDMEKTHPLRDYAQTLLNEMGVTSKDIEKRLGHRRAEHFFYTKNAIQFSLCTEETYNELIKTYHIDELDCFKPYEELKGYTQIFNLPPNEKTKSNVLQYKKSYNHYHPTEKPVPLLEDLIKIYTNENDLILDFTMGSGSTGVACMNTNRNFIGIELDKDYYNIASERIKEANEQKKLI